MRLSCVYVTVPDKKTGETIAKDLLEKRLVACVNLFDGVTSFFHWNNQINVAQESVLFIKTTSEILDQVIEEIKEQHPYECPCVVSWSLEKGCPVFMEWVEKECALREDEES